MVRAAVVAMGLLLAGCGASKQQAQIDDLESRVSALETKSEEHESSITEAKETADTAQTAAEEAQEATDTKVDK